MIVTDEKIIEILKREVLDDTDVLQLIVNYVWEKKNHHIERINRPDNKVRVLLLQTAQTVVCDYYTKKLMKNDEQVDRN